MLSTVVFETKMVASPVSHSSPQDSFNLKKTATPIMEMQMKASEMISRIFRPTFSMISIVKPVPATCELISKHGLVLPLVFKLVYQGCSSEHRTRAWVKGTSRTLRKCPDLSNLVAPRCYLKNLLCI